MLSVSHLHGHNANMYGSLAGPGLLVAVATYAGGAGNNLVMTSPNGVNWTTQTSAENNSWVSVCWNQSLKLFCAVSLDGTHRVMTSPNGIDWTAQTAASQSTWRSVCSLGANGFFAAGTGVSSSATSFMTSADGVTWANKTADAHKVFNAVILVDEHYDNVNLVAVSDDGASDGAGNTYRSSISRGGTDWEASTVEGSESWICLVDINSEFILTLGNTVAAYHPQGAGVTDGGVIVQGWGYEAAAWGGDPNTVPKANRIGWAKFLTVPAGVYRSAAYTPALARAVAVSSTGSVASIECSTSMDHDTVWTARTAAAAVQWYGVCWSPFLHLFVAVAASGTAAQQVMYSADGITWVAATAAANIAWKSVCWGTP